MKICEGNKKKYEATQDLEEFQAFQQGGGKSYADAYADTIPGMTPSTEREGRSPAKNKKCQIINVFDKQVHIHNTYYVLKKKRFLRTSEELLLNSIFSFNDTFNFPHIVFDRKRLQNET